MFGEIELFRVQSQLMDGTNISVYSNDALKGVYTDRHDHRMAHRRTLGHYSEIDLLPIFDTHPKGRQGRHANLGFHKNVEIIARNKSEIV